MHHQQNLWRKVLLLALHDAANGRDLDYLESEDFLTVCSLAGLDPDGVMRVYAPERFQKMPTAA